MTGKHLHVPAGGLVVASATTPPRVTPAHDQLVTRRYTIHYPDHAPRFEDPHYADFNAYHRKHHADAVCIHAKTGDCAPGPLELHHKIIEFALANAVDFQLLEADYPGISDPHEVGVWIETDVNFEWLCPFHHRGHGGVHVASAADFTASFYIRGLLT